MEFEVSYELESADQFWDELDDILSTNCQTHELIDNALRSYLSFTTNYKDEYLQTDYDVARCTYKLLESDLFKAQKDYVRRQIVYGLLQEDEPASLHLIAAILLYDGRSSDELFEMMQTEGAFARIVELLPNIEAIGADRPLHSLLLSLMYEMSRIQRLTWEDLTTARDDFVLYLFKLIEELSDDASDPYHYAVIRVLLVLNEQYMMVSATGASLTNRVVKCLASHGNSYKTFGENLILLLNRESETSLQLLILKLLYLIFSSESTAEYFYTNDLHVLVDVILRNLLDLPGPFEEGGEASGALRHTYLRVLHPILANSQLQKPSMHYKRNEIRKILRLLGSEFQAQPEGGEGNSDKAPGGFGHFAPIDATTLRLVRRCADVDWLRDSTDSPASDISPTFTLKSVNSFASPDPGGTDSHGRDAEGAGRREVAKRALLGMSSPNGTSSTSSMLELAEQHEKPGVLSPSKTRAAKGLGMELNDA